MITQADAKLIRSIVKESGVPIKTIRYYEELGLLKNGTPSANRQPTNQAVEYQQAKRFLA